MQVERLHHTSVPRPPGKEAHRRAVDFYSGILGLEHIPMPPTFVGKIEVTWFRCGENEIHVYAMAADEQVPHSGAHFCLIVEDLQATRDQLERAGCRCDDAVPIPHRPRFYTWDPFGNWIEITSIEGDYMA
jgi:predicted enzyme related to lactoylglutathione lyase